MATNAQIQQAKQQISETYVSAFGRTPDSAGFSYWVNVLLNGASIEAIAEGFTTSVEYNLEYPAYLTNDEYVTEIYENVFNRAPDATGLAYWSNLLSSGQLTHSTVMIAMVEAANSGNNQDTQLLVNKTAFGIYCAELNIDIQLSTPYLNSMTSSSASLDAAKAAVYSGANTHDLTTAQDVFTVQDGGATFVADVINNANTLQNGDSIVATGTGNKLIAELGNSAAFAVEASVKGVQTVQIQALANAVDSANNNPFTESGAVQINAMEMPDVKTWINDSSRADVTIESIQLASAAEVTKALTFIMRNTDNGNTYTNTTDTATEGVSFEAYIDPQALRAAPQTSTTSVEIGAGNASPTNVYSQAQFDVAPLKYLPLVGFYVVRDGTSPMLVEFSAADQSAIFNTGTQITLTTAITNALAAFNLANQTAITFTEIIDGFDFYSQDGAFREDSSYILQEQGHALSVPANGWEINKNLLPANVGVQLEYIPNNQSSDAPLIEANVVLDHVGQGSMLQDKDYNGALGSSGGDMIVGSMASSGGVQQFNVSVQNGSWLNSLASTNDTLQVVKVVNSVDVSPITKTMADSQSHDNFLTIGASYANASDNDDNLTGWQTHGILAASNGLTNVQTVDASAYTGSLMIGQTINTDAIQKYLANSYNTVEFTVKLGSNTTGVTVPAANASYAATSPATQSNSTDILTASFNSVNEEIASSVIASGNAEFTFTGSTGNDFINLTVENDTNSGIANEGAWTVTQERLNNLTINLSSGNNIVSFNGSGEASISADAGDDAYYLDNTGAKEVWMINTNDVATDSYDVATGHTITWAALLSGGVEQIGGATIASATGATDVEVAAAVAAAASDATWGSGNKYTYTAGSGNVITVESNQNMLSTLVSTTGNTTVFNGLLNNTYYSTTNGVVNNNWDNYVTASTTESLASHTFTTNGSAATVYVEYNGYTTAATITQDASKQFDTLDVNNAIVSAINMNTVMSKMLNATLASSGNTIILTSLVDGVQIDPTINVSATYSTLTASSDARAEALIESVVNANNTSNILYGSASNGLNLSDVVDSGSTSTGANVIDLSSAVSQTINGVVYANTNSVTLYGRGNDVLVNADANDIVYFQPSSQVVLYGDALTTVRLDTIGGNVATSAIASFNETSVAGTTAMSVASNGAISFTGTPTVSGTALADAVQSLIASKAATDGNAYYVMGGNTYLFSVDAGVATSYVELVGVDISSTGLSGLNLVA